MKDFATESQVYDQLVDIVPPHLLPNLEFMYPGFIEYRLTNGLTLGFDGDTDPGLWRVVYKYRFDKEQGCYESETYADFSVGDNCDARKIAETIYDMVR